MLKTKEHKFQMQYLEENIISNNINFLDKDTIVLYIIALKKQFKNACK